MGTGKEVLEVGAGHGIGSEYIARYARSYVAGEYSSENIQLIIEKEAFVRCVQMDAHKLPFVANSFDLVLALAMIYYLDLNSFVYEVKRVLNAGDHNDFLREHIKLKPGPIISLTPYPSALRASPLGKGRKMAESLRVPLLAKEGLGEVIGEHQCLPLYTIGQRRGVEIGGIGPFYAAKCDYKTNTLYVVSGRDDPVLYSNELIAGDVNWISGKEPKLPLSCHAVIRYRHKPVKCRLSPQPPLLIRRGGGDPAIAGETGERYSVKFNKPQRAVTPGQSVVLYKGDEALGGGIIVA
ncbi:methyltransferase domain-containing protein [Candidatus Parcubacteria bacterium]|nr:methyltransferase domain-containing protein [Candidatus Parcubacteria bacterium]